VTKCHHEIKIDPIYFFLSHITSLVVNNLSVQVNMKKMCLSW